MKIEVMKLADLRQAEKNTRIHNRKQIDELVRSINMFGQIRPAVIDEDNVVWCGNGLVEAAKAAGWTEIDVYRVTGLTDAQKKKLMLADNQTFLLGATNTSVMDEILTELQDWDVPGYDADTLRQLYGAIEEATEELQAYGKIDDETVQSIERVEAARAEETHAQVFIQGTPETPSGAPTEAQNTTVTDDESLLPSHIEAADGMVNIPKDRNTKPYIVCPKCGEKIWV